MAFIFQFQRINPYPDLISVDRTFFLSVGFL
jgi:hypothetical protein